jgi:carbon-monoxide dehydrogenase medium subunit
MTIQAFDLLQPRSLTEAVEMLARHGEDCRPIGGGTTLIILMKQRAVHYRYLVDLQTIPGLAEIKSEADGLRIGALVTHHTMETSPLVRQAFPALSQAFSQIGNVRVRQTASVGGNLAHADYRLDPPPVLLALNAALNIFGPRGARTVPIRNFFRGMYETDLAPDELLVDVKIPFMRGDSRVVYLRYCALSANDWPSLGVAAFLCREGERCTELRVAVGGLAATPLAIDGLDFAAGTALTAGVIEQVVDATEQRISPSADFRGSEWYKRRMARLFVKRALEQLSSNGA